MEAEVLQTLLPLWQWLSPPLFVASGCCDQSTVARAKR